MMASNSFIQFKNKDSLFSSPCRNFRIFVSTAIGQTYSNGLHQCLTEIFNG